MPKDRHDPLARFDPASASPDASTTSIYLPADLLEWANAQAAARGWSRNRFITACLLSVRAVMPTPLVA